jgi:hypothetical protein
MFDACPESAPFFGFMGITSAVVFASMWPINACPFLSNDSRFIFSVEFVIFFQTLAPHTALPSPALVFLPWV